MVDEPDAHEIMRSAQRTARELLVDGLRWLVYEVTIPFDRRGPSLIFESHDIVRRLRTYPEEWRSLSDAKLAELMGGT